MEKGYKELKTENGEITGAVDEFGTEYKARAIILTTGTSLEGRIFVGLRSFSAGRLGEKAAIGLSESLHKLGIETKKLKTGTPARVDKRTIDYSKMIIQPGDEELNFFSFKPNRPIRPTYPCYLTKTNEETHKIIRENLDKSPMYQGLIQGVGPRYCPSIEDKIVRFASNPSHHIFIEPEGLNTYEVYIQGFSTSLPACVQVEMLRSLPGLEKAHIIKPAYAVEYDYVPAVQTKHSLMSKDIAVVMSSSTRLLIIEVSKLSSFENSFKNSTDLIDEHHLSNTESAIMQELSFLRYDPVKSFWTSIPFLSRKDSASSLLKNPYILIIHSHFSSSDLASSIGVPAFLQELRIISYSWNELTVLLSSGLCIIL